MAISHTQKTTNFQLRIPIEFFKALEALESMKSKKKSEFVREAIMEKLEREKTQLFEEQWILALQQEMGKKLKSKKRSENSDDWSTVEAWEAP